MISSTDTDRTSIHSLTHSFIPRTACSLIILRDCSIVRLFVFTGTYTPRSSFFPFDTGDWDCDIEGLNGTACSENGFAYYPSIDHRKRECRYTIPNITGARLSINLQIGGSGVVSARNNRTSRGFVNKVVLGSLVWSRYIRRTRGLRSQIARPHA